MSRYKAQAPPNNAERDLADYLYREFNRVQVSLDSLFDGVQDPLRELPGGTDPVLVFGGEEVDLGDGAGLYLRIGSTWYKLSMERVNFPVATGSVRVRGLTPTVQHGFPIIESVGEYNPSVATSTHHVTMPSGIQSGDMLIMVIRTASSGSLSAPNFDWTLVSGTSSSVGHANIRARIADGTENDNPQVIDSTTEQLASAITFRISNHSGHRQGTWAVSSDPPSVNPSWGSANNLYIAVHTHRQPSTEVTGAPTNYDIGTLITVSTPCSGAECDETTRTRVEAVHREATAVPENPDAFTLSTTPDSPRAATIAVGNVF